MNYLLFVYHIQNNDYLLFDIVFIIELYKIYVYKYLKDTLDDAEQITETY